MSSSSMRVAAWMPQALVLAVAWLLAQPVEAVTSERVTFKSGELSLVGYLYKPQGSGPWPALIWNHGSERNPDPRRQFDTVAAIFVPAGYVVFAPVRRGHGVSEGNYIVDETQSALKQQGREASLRLAVQLLESEQLIDQLAGLGYVKQLPFVDSQRLAVAGCSYGGIGTLLGAESGAGYRAAVSISPAALSWEGNPFLRTRLLNAVARLDIPVLLIQPPKDDSLEPVRVLGKQAALLGKPLTAKVYPAQGPQEQQGHCFGGARGMHVWADEAKAFLAEKLAKQ
jgi:carboxymethylenebutenolidase